MPDISPSADVRESYLELLKLCLTGLISPQPVWRRLGSQQQLVFPFPAHVPFVVEGRAKSLNGYTMIGLKRLDNLQACVGDVIRKGVPGDLIEAGVWRGGAAIFMRALLKAHGVEDRVVVAADSFYPAPTAGAGLEDTSFVPFLHVPIEQVRQNFRRFGFLDNQVQMVEGWFQDTLPTLRERTWSVIRSDGERHDGTMVTLEHLYPSLSPGGYMIIDNYGASEPCRKAVDDYRKAQGIDDEIHMIDWTEACWQKSR